MTKELKSLEPKELKRLNEAIGTIERAYGLTDEDIDSFFVLVKNAKRFAQMSDENAKDIASLKKALYEDTRSDAKRSVDTMMQYFTKKPEGLNDGR